MFYGFAYFFPKIIYFNELTRRGICKSHGEFTNLEKEVCPECNENYENLLRF